MSAPIPYVVRWLNAVKDDPNPVLTWRGLAAAGALVRYANATTGRDCWPGAQRCADDMRVSMRTIHTGWAELKEAGWLEIMPLPQGRRRSHGATKVLRWPTDIVHDVQVVETTSCTTGIEPLHDVHTTIPGNGGEEPPSGDEVRAGKKRAECSSDACTNKPHRDGFCRDCLEWLGR